MNRVPPIFLVGLSSLFILSAAAQAAPYSPAAEGDASWVTLAGNARAEYRFDYRGDRTPIEVALDANGAAGIALLVYAALPDGAKPGPSDPPVGLGTPSRAHDLFWSGRFNTPGTYFVAVQNNAPWAILYHLAITGESVGGVSPLLADTGPENATLAAPGLLAVTLPPGAGPAELRLSVPGPPGQCTHANQVPPVISSSLLLCPNEIYPPLHLVGDHLALYSDAGHSAVVTSAGRQFAVTVDGSGDFIEGVTIQASADSQDAGAWLCQYDQCVFPTRPRPTTIAGGIVYGGGILLRGSYSTIHAVTVRGGTIGIATVNGQGNNLLDNRLSDLNGWGIFNLASQGGYFVGNTLNRENHGCTTPDGFTFEHGCETSGWVCLACAGNVIARNHCESSANCFYMSGERGLASDDNRFVANYCAGATDNCFEITFSRGNLLRDNVAAADPNTGGACNYPFWIGGSTVHMQNNTWQCSIGAEEALALAAASTTVPTAALDLGGSIPPAAGSVPPAGQDSTGGTPRPPRGLLE